MIGRIVEIAEDGRHLAAFRGFLVISAEGRELGRVPLDDIGALISNAHGLTYTNAVLLALTGRGVPVVLCGPNHSPQAILWPVDGHYEQAGRWRDQLRASRPLCKQLWKLLVQAKIAYQAAALAAIGHEGREVAALVDRVRSGDPENLEAQAARRYWPLLMGPDFRRDTGGSGANALLNYGYAILRSGAARAVMAAGLMPGIGVFHRNRQNPMPLVDDLLEPFRPIVDLEVRRLVRQGRDAVTPETKSELARLLHLDLRGGEGLSPLGECLGKLAISLAQSFATGKPTLKLPEPRLPLSP